MKPQKKYVTIGNNVKRIEKLMGELVLQPRLKILEWSKITKQTPSIKIGYVGQHLASIVVGMPGQKTGARGNDIVDGSEVKSCNRVDASDVCKNNICKTKISRFESVCPDCGSADIKRDKTSKWLFTIRSKKDLRILTEDVKRIILVLADYPNFDKNDFEEIRFQVFEIWTNSPRCKAFKDTMKDYYENVFLAHKKKDNAKTPAPQNFWPYDFRFYLCNPIKIFSCAVKNANKNPRLKIELYISPKMDRRELPSELMPTDKVKKVEFSKMIKRASAKEITENLIDKKSYKAFRSLIKKKSFKMEDVCDYMPSINEALRKYISIRKAVPHIIEKEHTRH